MLTFCHICTCHPSSATASSQGLLLQPLSATTASSEGYFCNHRQPLRHPEGYFCNHRQPLLRHPRGYFCNHRQPLLRHPLLRHPMATFATIVSHCVIPRATFATAVIRGLLLPLRHPISHHHRRHVLSSFSFGFSLIVIIFILLNTICY